MALAGDFDNYSDDDLPQEYREMLLKLRSEPRKPIPEFDCNQHGLDGIDGSYGKD